MEDAIDTVVGATRAMFVLYCMAAATAGLAMFTGLAAVLKGGMLGGMFNAGLHMFAFLILGLASAISTTVIDKVKDAVDEVGSDVGIEAIKGYKFLTLTWVATLMMGLGSVGWTMDFFLAKRRLAKVIAEKVESVGE
jgi:SUR7/PalI family